MGLKEGLEMAWDSRPKKKKEMAWDLGVKDLVCESDSNSD